MLNKRTKTKKIIKDSWGSIPIRIGQRQSKNGRIKYVISYLKTNDQFCFVIWL